jgi:hypothetical protein
MSYSCAGATRVPYFSSPVITYSGKTTGTGTADNARVLQETRFVVANYRKGSGQPLTKPPTPVPTRKCYAVV